MTIRNIHDYRVWIKGSGRWSLRAQNDLISRLNRADKIFSIDSFNSFENALAMIQSSSAWNDIPKTSRASIAQATRVYFEWKDSLNRI